MHLVHHLHQNGIGVIPDRVPSDFRTTSTDWHTSTALICTSTPTRVVAFDPDWKSSIFNYGRTQVCVFLISNAVYWLDRYHVDGLRMDAIAPCSISTIRASRESGSNEFGGCETLRLSPS